MANLNVSYEAMLSEATQLQNGKEQITQQLQALRSRINNLVTSGFVTDSASGAFNRSYEQFNHGATTTIAALDDLAHALRNVATTLQQTDHTLAQQMGN